MGFDPKTLELYIIGQDQAYPNVNAGAVCSGATTTLTGTCTHNAAWAMLEINSDSAGGTTTGYNPPAAESVWDIIASNEATLLPSNPNLMFEVDVTGPNSFPAAQAGQSCNGRSPKAHALQMGLRILHVRARRPALATSTMDQVLDRSD